MSADQVEIEIAADPSAVWAVVGDFGAIGEMIPGLESFRLEGDDRVIGMFGMEIRERLISRDDDGRALTYSIVDGVPIEQPPGDGLGGAGRRRVEGDVGVRRHAGRDGADPRRHVRPGARRAGHQVRLTA